jgi:hypothetical protein
VSAAYSKVSAAMQSISGMAGSDPAAQEWGAGFDEFLAQVPRPITRRWARSRIAPS